MELNSYYKRAILLFASDCSVPKSVEANRGLTHTGGDFMGQELEQIGQKGTVVWGINRLRSDALAALLDDLVLLESSGLDEQHCRAVRRSLARFTNAATSIPDGSWWKRQIWQELQDFEVIYEQWNNVPGTDSYCIDERAKKLKQLRKKRNKIATKIRNNQYILQNELDLKLVHDSYEALGDLVKALPSIFKNLAAAVNRFNKEAS
jgi:hypothetical protein